jgi:hypothetical protein
MKEVHEWIACHPLLQLYIAFIVTLEAFVVILKG